MRKNSIFSSTLVRDYLKRFYSIRGSQAAGAVDNKEDQNNIRWVRIAEGLKKDYKKFWGRVSQEYILMLKIFSEVRASYWTWSFWYFG